MKMTIRNKLIVGYFISMGSIVLVAVYGYLSFNAVIAEKAGIEPYADSLSLSNQIDRRLRQARLTEKRFLQTGDGEVAHQTRINILKVKLDTYRLLPKIKPSGNKKQISQARAMATSAENYLDTFAYLESAFSIKGHNEHTGLLGQLNEARQAFETRIPEVIYLKLKALELEYRLNYLDLDTVSYQEKMDFLIRDEIEKTDFYSIVAKDLRHYQSLFREMGDIDLEIKAGLLSNDKASRIIQGAVEENLRSAETVLGNQQRLADQLIDQQNTTLAVFSVTGILIGVISLLILGMEPLELSTVLQEQAAILEAINDGIIAVNRSGKIQVINSRAREILKLDKAPLGVEVHQVLPNTRLLEVMNTGQTEFFQEQIVGEITIVTTRVPIRLRNKIIGGVACFREKGEMAKMAEELTQVKLFIDALRANNHEFQNKLHTIQGMIQLEQYHEVVEYVHAQNHSHRKTVSLYVDRIREPTVSAIMLGKFNRANEMGTALRLEEDSFLEALPSSTDTHAIASILGNLIQNAMEAVSVCPPPKRNIWVTVKETPKELFFAVRDSGPGIASEIAEKVFDKGVSTKFYMQEPDKTEIMSEKNMGMGLYICRNHVENLGGDIHFYCGKHTVFEVTLPKMKLIH